MVKGITKIQKKKTKKTTANTRKKAKKIISPQKKKDPTVISLTTTKSKAQKIIKKTQKKTSIRKRNVTPAKEKRSPLVLSKVPEQDEKATEEDDFLEANQAQILFVKSK